MAGPYSTRPKNKTTHPGHVVTGDPAVKAAERESREAQHAARQAERDQKQAKAIARVQAEQEMKAIEQDMAMAHAINMASANQPPVPPQANLPKKLYAGGTIRMTRRSPRNADPVVAPASPTISEGTLSSLSGIDDGAESEAATQHTEEATGDSDGAEAGDGGPVAATQVQTDIEGRASFTEDMLKMANDIQITEGTIIYGDGPPAISITGGTPVKKQPSAKAAKSKGKGRGRGKAGQPDDATGPSPMRPSTKRRDDSESKADSKASSEAQIRAAVIAVAKKSKLSLPLVSGPAEDVDISMALLGPDGKVVARTGKGFGRASRVPSSRASSVATSRASSLAPSAPPSSRSSSRASTPALAPTSDHAPPVYNVGVKQEPMDVELVHRSIQGMVLEEPVDHNQAGVQLQVTPGSGTASLPIDVDSLVMPTSIPAVVSASKRGVTQQSHIPAELQRVFKEVFLYTVLQLVGTSEHPWDLSNPQYCYTYYRCVKKIWDFVCPGHVAFFIPNQLNIFTLINGKVHSWRNSFSKDALSAVLDYLEKDLHYAKEEYADFSTFMISDRRPFVFEEFDEADSVAKGVFRAKPILKTVYKHQVTVMKAARWDESILDAPPIGAIAMATAAVERAYGLLAQKQDPNAELDMADGANHFNFEHWGPNVRYYIGQLKKLRPSQTRKIVEGVAMCKTSTKLTVQTVAKAPPDLVGAGYVSDDD